MRIGEPLRLLRSHCRIDEGTVYIEKTKFIKDRHIPLPKPALTELGNYLSARRALIDNDANSFLLAATADLPLSEWHVRKAYDGALVSSRTYQYDSTDRLVSISDSANSRIRRYFRTNMIETETQRCRSRCLDSLRAAENQR